MQIRALTSAADSSKAWDLRCHVREGLIRFLQEKFPESLPKTRAGFSGSWSDGRLLPGAPGPVTEHTVSHGTS
jgi:hypothetical protein